MTDEGTQLGRKRVERETGLGQGIEALIPPEPVATDGRPIRRREFTAAELMLVRDRLAEILDIGGAPQRKAEALLLADVIDIEAVLALESAKAAFDPWVYYSYAVLDAWPESWPPITEEERKSYAVFLAQSVDAHIPTDDNLETHVLKLRQRAEDNR